MTMAPTSGDDDAGIDDLLRLIPSSSVEHMPDINVSLAYVHGGTGRSAGNLQLRPPTQQQHQNAQMHAMLSLAFSTSTPRQAETPKSVQELVLPSPALGGGGASNLDLLPKSPFENGVGTSGTLGLLSTSTSAASSASSSSSSTPEPSFPEEAPPLIELPKGGNTSCTPTSPFGGGLLDFGMTSAAFSTFNSTSDKGLFSSTTITTGGGACKIPNAASKGITADEFYAKILEDMLYQAKSVEEAYERDEAYERGISWRELLNNNMDLHPLAATTPTASAKDSDKVIITTIFPRRHYLPILLEAARVWRRAVDETIDRRLDRDIADRYYSDWEDRSEYDDDDDNNGGKYKYKLAQHIIPPVDRRLLAKQAGWIVQRYLALHGVFSSSSGDNDEVSEGTTKYIYL